MKPLYLLAAAALAWWLLKGHDAAATPQAQWLPDWRTGLKTSVVDSPTLHPDRQTTIWAANN